MERVKVGYKTYTGYFLNQWNVACLNNLFDEHERSYGKEYKECLHNDWNRLFKMYSIEGKNNFESKTTGETR